MRDAGECPGGSAGGDEDKGKIVFAQGHAARHADPEDGHVGGVGLAEGVQIGAALAVVIGCRRAGPEFLQPIIEEGAAIRPPRGGAELRAIDRIGEHLAARHLEHTQNAVLRAGRRDTVRDVAAVP